MTEEKFPTRRSMRLAREAAERAEREARLRAEIAETAPSADLDAPIEAPVEAPKVSESGGTASGSSVDTPAVDAPAVSAPAVSTPAVSTPAGDAPAVSAPAVDTPTWSGANEPARTDDVPADAPRTPADSSLTSADAPAWSATPNIPVLESSSPTSALNAPTDNPTAPADSAPAPGTSPRRTSFRTAAAGSPTEVAAAGSAAEVAATGSPAGSPAEVAAAGSAAEVAAAGSAAGSPAETAATGITDVAGSFGAADATQSTFGTPATTQQYASSGTDVPQSYPPADTANTPEPLHFDDIVIERDNALAHARRRRGHRVAKTVALSLAALLTFATAGAAAVYQRLNGNIDIVKVNNLLQDQPGSTFEPPNDPNAGEALNYLVIGVDDRSGKNGALTDRSTGGSRSDTTMVLHISKNRKRVEVVSIPRDSMVSIPSCQLTNGGSTGATFGMFNNAYAYGYDQGGDYESAIACTWRTVQENSGVKIDGAILVDFAGFAGVVDAIGGVYMCIPEETISKDAGKLHLQAGWQTLKGTDALNYARARKGIGQNFDGSDLTRTGRQQQMIAAIFNQVMEDGVLTNPAKIFKLADATTKTLTVTDTLADTTDLVGLGYSLRNIRSKNITFMTIPYEAYPADRNRVQWSAEADTVWENMANDRPVFTSDSPQDDSTSGSTNTDTSGDSGTTGDAGTSGNAGTAGDAGTTTGNSETGTDATKSEPEVTKIPGREAFTAEETTAVCVADAPKNGK